MDSEHRQFIRELNEYMNENKESFEAFKTKRYPESFEYRLIGFIQSKNFDVEKFKNMLSFNFDYEFTHEGLLHLLVYKNKLGDSISAYIELVGEEFAVIFYQFLNEIPILHTKNTERLRESYRMYELDLEHEFKNKFKKENDLV